MAVDAEAFPGLGEPRTVRCLTLRSGLTLTSGHEDFGGYSDLLFTAAAQTALVVSDAGHLVRFGLVLSEAGDVVGIASAETTGLIERDGSRLGKRDGDAEALADIGAGYAVAFEGEDRIAVMDASGFIGRTLYPPADLEPVLGFNSGFEALTALPDGTLLALSEGKTADGDALVRRGRISEPLAEWAAGTYRPAEDFNVTGASIDPATGDLFVLERAYSPWRGARMQVVRVPAERLGEPALRGRVLTRMGFLEGIDNMEGIAAVRTESGELRLYLISDDNYSAAQRTIVLTLGLAPGCKDGDAAETAAGRDAATEHAVEP